MNGFLKYCTIFGEITLVTVLLVGCTSIVQSKCNDAILNSALNTQVGVFEDGDVFRQINEYVFEVTAEVNKSKVDKYQWVITKRSENSCEITLSALINGKEGEKAAYYIDLDQSEIYADNELGKTILSMSRKLESDKGLKIQLSK